MSCTPFCIECHRMSYSTLLIPWSVKSPFQVILGHPHLRLTQLLRLHHPWLHCQSPWHAHSILLFHLVLFVPMTLLITKIKSNFLFSFFINANPYMFFFFLSSYLNTKVLLETLIISGLNLFNQVAPRLSCLVCLPNTCWVNFLTCKFYHLTHLLHFFSSSGSSVLHWDSFHFSKCPYHVFHFAHTKAHPVAQ